MKHLPILFALMALTISAHAMSYEDVKEDAYFLTDKMAYELSLTDEQYEAVYEINLDYLLCLNKADDLFGIYWERRNSDLRFVLSDWQYRKYLDIEYFYRPVKWEADAWVFLMYTHYARDLFYFTYPKVFTTYFGGNSFKNERFYADRIHNKPASADHHHGPAAHGTAPAPNNSPKPTAPNNNAQPASPNNVRPGATNNTPQPVNSNVNNRPTNPNATNRPSNPNTNNRPSSPNANPRPSTPNNGGGRPAGGGPGGGPGGRR